MKKQKHGQQPTYKGIPEDFASNKEALPVQDDETTVAEKKIKHTSTRMKMRVKRT